MCISLKYAFFSVMIKPNNLDICNGEKNCKSELIWYHISISKIQNMLLWKGVQRTFYAWHNEHCFQINWWILFSKFNSYYVLAFLFTCSFFQPSKDLHLITLTVFAVGSIESRYTLTLVGIDLISACSIVLTRLWYTFVYIWTKKTTMCLVFLAKDEKYFF